MFLKIFKLFFQTLKYIGTLTLLIVLYILITPNSIDIAPPAYTKIEKTLYVDPAFNDLQIKHIINSAKSWNEATNHFVSFRVLVLPQRHVNFTQGILILKASHYYPDIIQLDAQTGLDGTLGLCRKDEIVPNIQLVAERLDEETFEPAVMHELGHYLGLKHNASIDGINTLMYPAYNLSANYITRTDLKNLCKIYKCDAKKMYPNVPDDGELN